MRWIQTTNYSEIKQNELWGGFKPQIITKYSEIQQIIKIKPLSIKIYINHL